MENKNSGRSEGRYGRLLRYVWLEDGSIVNATLVAEGYAQVATYPPDVRYVDRFTELQRMARAEGRGLWDAVPTKSAEGECDAAYPDACIPAPPPDLDCGEIAHRNFTVLAPDPHWFDRDRDGVGCGQEEQIGPKPGLPFLGETLKKHFQRYGTKTYIGRKLKGPASLRQKNSNFPIGSTVSEVNKYIKAKKLHNPNPPP